MNDTCVFCRIVRGELPANKLYEDEHVLAFMDIGPIVKGHALVIPKAHIDRLPRVPADTLDRVMVVVQKIVDAQLAGLKADGVNVHQANGAAAGQVVPHVHFHVIPRFKSDGHSWHWSAKKYDAPEEMHRFAEAIRAALS